MGVNEGIPIKKDDLVKDLEKLNKKFKDDLVGVSDNLLAITDESYVTRVVPPIVKKALYVLAERYGEPAGNIHDLAYYEKDETWTRRIKEEIKKIKEQEK